MKNLFVFVLLTGLLTSCMSKCTGCSTPVASKPQRTWVPHEYKLCEMNVINNPPIDFVVTLNRTNLPFGRYDGLTSCRTHVVYQDGSNEAIGNSLVTRFEQEGVQNSSFSKDGSVLMLTKMWEDPFNAMYEEANGGLNFNDPSTYRSDVISYNFNTKEYNVLTQDGPSFYNGGGVFTPDQSKLTFSSMINKDMRSYTMNLDGSNKTPLVTTSGFQYGLSLSPDGKKYAFHSNDKVFIGDIATGVEAPVNNPYDFNFNPIWSPDSQHIVFYCGDKEICVANRDGSGARSISVRTGPVVSVPIIDGYDFHGGGSDMLSWGDSNSIIVSDYVGSNAELYKTDINTKVKTRLTYGKEGSWSNFPFVSSDGQWLLYTSNRTGVRNVYYMNLNDMNEVQVTDLDVGCTSRYPKWRN